MPPYRQPTPSPPPPPVPPTMASSGNEAKATVAQDRGLEIPANFVPPPPPREVGKSTKLMNDLHNISAEC